MLTIATCRFTRFEPDMGVPVRSTAGAPRFKLRYELAGVSGLTAPAGWMLKLDRPRFEESYRGRLASAGVEGIRAELEAFAGLDGCVVLLCFENLSDPDTWCHRTLFAAWWREQTGEDVPELAEQTPAAPNPTLF